MMNEWFDANEDVVIRPEIDRARFWRQKFGRDVIDIAPQVIFANNGHGRLFDAVCAMMDGRAEIRADYRQAGYCHYQREGQFVTVYQAPEPAPYAAGALEHIISAGAKEILFLNGAGSLREDVPVGSVLLPQGLVREDGTSYHYAPVGTLQTDGAMNWRIQAAAGQVQVNLMTGKHWTTDAIYRETWSKVDRYRASGVNSVDMELSALAAVAGFRQCSLSAVLVVTDVCARSHTWDGITSTRFRAGVQQAARLGVQVFFPF